MSKRKASEILEKNADAIHIGDLIWIWGQWMKVVNVEHRNRHPYQLYVFKVDEFRDYICVPAGWTIETKRK